MYFAYFQNLSIKVPKKCENYIKPVGTLGNYLSKCPDIIENMVPILAHMNTNTRSGLPRLLQGPKKIGTSGT